MYCRKQIAKILKCYLIPKKSYGTLFKVAIFFGQPCNLFLSEGGHYLKSVKQKTSYVEINNNLLPCVGYFILAMS